MVDVARLQFCGATLDSRQVKPGMLFVAMKGERVDGHDFIPQALAAGAAGVIDGPDELAAAARAWRALLSAKVIGVTGSAGKTTTKELIAAFLLAGGHKVHATAGNYNNDLGLPLTILNCPRDAEFLVLEMGTNHPGEIRHLVGIARPFAGAISSIGTAHIEFFKTQDGIADEKGELFRRVKDFAVVSRENARFEMLRAMCPVRVVETSRDDMESDVFRMALRDKLPGEHNVSNARLAFAVAAQYGAKLHECVNSLAGFRLPGHRWEITEQNGVTYVNDAYNANPDSMVAALDAFVQIYGRKSPAYPGDEKKPQAGGSRHLVAVLGDMFELGENSLELHRKVFRHAMSLGIDLVIGVGEMSSQCLCNLAYRKLDDLRKKFRVDVSAGDVVLLKGSRGMQLEKLLERWEAKVGEA